jgi:hemerythrin
MIHADPSYEIKLTELATRRPHLAAALRRAEQHRARSAASLMGGARFKGLDELLRHLDELLQAFIADPKLGRIAFLIYRSRADLETAIEATLSGYVAVAVDAMRDVMEIENLLLDFAVNPVHIDEWLTADRKTLLGKFGPARVRDRLHAAGEGRYAATAESVDYRAHSAALHVNPHQDLVAARGFSTEQGWAGDAGFWEIFEHTRRLRHAIQRLTGVLRPGSAADQIAGQELTDVQDAWQRTQEMQASYIALLETIAKTQTEG